MRTTSVVGRQRPVVSRAAAREVRRGATALAARARVERRGALSLNQVAVLGRVVARGPLTPGEVAAQLRTQPQSLTRTFAALEVAGYLHRAPDPSDGRQALLVATAEGRSALSAEMAPRDAWVRSAMQEVLTPAECGLLVAAAELLNRLAEVDADIAPVES
jgi:DNA-binding MarR family transcriptional regulator